MTSEEYIEKTKKIESLKREIQTLELETIIFEKSKENELIKECSKIVGKVVKQDMGDGSVRFMLVDGLKTDDIDRARPIVLVGKCLTIIKQNGQDSIYLDDNFIYVYDSVEKSHVTITLRGRCGIFSSA